MDRKKFLYTPWGFTIEGNDLWFVPVGINMLCKYNLLTKRIEKTVTFPDMSIEHWGAYNVKKFENYIVTVPAFERNIYMYDSTNDTVTKIDLEVKEYNPEFFLDCSYWKGQIYFFPITYNCVIKVSLIDRSVTEIPLINGEKMFCSCIQVNQNTYLTNETGNIICFDMEREEFRYIEIDAREHLNNVVLQDENKLIISNGGKIIYIYDITSGHKAKKELPIKGNFGRISYCQEKLYLFPKGVTEEILVVNLKSLGVTMLSLKNRLKLPYDSEMVRNIKLFSIPIIVNNKIYVMKDLQGLYIIDVLSGVVTDTLIELEEMSEEQFEYFYNFIKEKGVFAESVFPFATMDFFVHNVEKKFEEKNQKSLKSIGKLIYETISLR